MNNEHHPYFNDHEEFSLTREERIRMRRVVWTYMEMKPIRSAAPAPAARAWNIGMLLYPRSVAAALVLALFASSAGVSYAAQNALPGDVLYPIKTNINEPVEGALAVSASAKTAWATEVAGERVKEAATLAASGKLSTSTQEALQQSFDQHADIAISAIESEASTSPDTGAQAAVSFEAQLSAYQQVLSDIATSTQGPSATLAAAIQKKNVRIASVRLHAEAAADAGASATTGSIAATHMRTAATAQLQTSRALAQQAGQSLSASSSAAVAVQIEGASTSIAGGDAFLGNDSPLEALNAFQGALTTAEKIGVFLQTSSSIHARTGLVIGEPTAATSSSSQKRSHNKNTANNTKNKKTGDAAKAAVTVRSASATSSDETAATTASGANDEQQATTSEDTPHAVPSTIAPAQPTVPISVPTATLPSLP